MTLSPFEEIVPTEAISDFSLTSLLNSFSPATTASTALSMPRCSATGLMPEVRALRPSV